jgi:hypothetical protein
MTSSSTRARTSSTISPIRRERSGPRRLGTMQNVHALLQPTEIDTHAWWRTSRLAGSADGKVSSCSTSSTTGTAAESAWASRPAGSRGCACRRPRRPRGRARRPRAVLLGEAAADHDREVAAVGAAVVLGLLEVSERAVEPVVGVLADRAGVHQDQVGVRLVDGGAVAERLEHAGGAPRVVGVHLAAERADEVAATDAARHAGTARSISHVDSSRPRTGGRDPATGRGRAIRPPWCSDGGSGGARHVDRPGCRARRRAAAPRSRRSPRPIRHRPAPIRTRSPARPARGSPARRVPARGRRTRRGEQQAGDADHEPRLQQVHRRPPRRRGHRSVTRARLPEHTGATSGWCGRGPAGTTVESGSRRPPARGGQIRWSSRSANTALRATLRDRPSGCPRRSR